MKNRVKIRKKWLSGLLAVMLLFVPACAKPSEPVPAHNQFFAMDTFMSLTAYGKNAEKALEAAALETYTLEALISSTNSGSELYRANGGETVAISAATRDILESALAMCARTDGLMDISMYPVVSAWGFTKQAYTDRKSVV